MQEGRMQEGCMQEGRMQEGRMQEGRMQEGRMQEGRMQEGRMQEGRMQEGRMPHRVGSQARQDAFTNASLERVGVDLTVKVSWARVWSPRHLAPMTTAASSRCDWDHLGSLDSRHLRDQ